MGNNWNPDPPLQNQSTTVTTMSNPARAPRENVQASKEPLMPDCHFDFMYAPPSTPAEVKAKKNAWYFAMKRAGTLDLVIAELEPLDMQIGEPFEIPREHTVDKQAFQSPKPFFAMAKKGNVTTRLRTDHARDVLNVAYGLLPEEWRVQVESKARDLALVDGGTEFAVGRLLMAYPRKGSHIRRPITEHEAREAWREEVGRLLTDDMHFETYADPLERTPYALLGGEGERAVKVNLKAGNGFPVLGKGSDPEARAKYLPMAEQVRAELEAAYGADPVSGVWNWVRTAEKERPWLVALQGKAKADYYTGQKIQDRKMRFYNVMGRQIMLNIQTATQVVEELAESILDDPGNRSASGVALNRGGAARLVDALEAQLRQGDQAHTRMGDDSWVAMVIGDVLLEFALDCSNFDLTQHGELTQWVHREGRKVVSRVDVISAQLLYAYWRQRMVATVMRAVYHFKHGGPSGLPGQSKVNGVVMGVCITRTCDRIRHLSDQGVDVTAEAVSAVLARVGEDMGIVIKLEQFRLTPLQTTRAEQTPLRYSLAQRPFLYLGYYFYNERDVVAVHADLPRSMSQMRYPTLKWVDNKVELRTLELARLASTLLSWGRPTEALRAAFDGVRYEVLKRLTAEIEVYGDYSSPKLRWAIALAAQGGDEDAFENALGSLSGIKRVLEKSWDSLWLSSADGDVSSADEHTPSFSPTEPRATVDLTKGAIRPPSRQPTTRTAGRNPNTKVFAPALPPRNPMSRVHENAGWTRDRVAGFNDPDDELAVLADRQAQELLAFGETALEREKRWEAEADFYASDDEEDRRGVLLDSEQQEAFLDDERWKL